MLSSGKKHFIHINKYVSNNPQLSSYVTPVPESLPGELAAPMLCAGVTTYAALKKCGANPGQWVVISGAGGGLGTIATSIAAGGMGFRVIGIDMPNKRESVLEGGAEHFIDLTAFDDEGIGKEVVKLTGLGAAAGKEVFRTISLLFGLLFESRCSLFGPRRGSRGF